MVFPVIAERSEKIVPVSCIPSPESPEKRITMSLRVLIAFCSSIAFTTILYNYVCQHGLRHQGEVVSSGKE